MTLTDSHTHIYYETDPLKRAELVQRAVGNGVTKMYLPNVNLASIPLVMDTAASFPDHCFPMLGLHPCDVKDNYLEELEGIEQALSQWRIWAIGEIGIDLYWDKTTLKQQQEAFVRQIHWATKLDLPIVIHCREAFDEAYDVLSSFGRGQLRGIFHCFTGTVEQAKKIVDLGLYLGIGGVVTYKNSGLAEVVAQLDLATIVLETDSPYLPPVPFRGKPNESSYLVHIAQKVADEQRLPVEEVARITTENCEKIFLRGTP